MGSTLAMWNRTAIVIPAAAVAICSSGLQITWAAVRTGSGAPGVIVAEAWSSVRNPPFPVEAFDASVAA